MSLIQEGLPKAQLLEANIDFTVRGLRKIAGELNVVASNLEAAAKAKPAAGKTSVLFRFKPDFLERIDAAARKQELPRQAWIRTVIASALEAQGL